MTQGFVQGMKLKMMREQQTREQQEFEREQAERQAAASGAALLGTAGQYQPQKTPEQQLSLDAADYQQKQAGAAMQGTVLAPAGMMLSSGAMSSSKPMGQAIDWENLKKHQSEFMSQASKAAAAMDPRLAGPFMEQARKAMQEDAVNLRRSHVSSWAQDGLISGMFYPPNPVDGAPFPDQGIAQKVSEIADAIQTGTVDPEQGQRQLQQIADLATNSRIEVRQRRSIVEQGRMMLDKSKQEGKVPTDEAEQWLDLYETGQIDRQTFQKDWPELAKGNVPYVNAYGRREFMPPENVAERQQEDELTRSLLAAYKAAQAEKLQAEAEFARQRPALEEKKIEASADKAAATEANRAENLKLRERSIDVQEAASKGNLELRAAEKESAAESRGANLILGKRNAERALNAKVMEIAQNDPEWLKADPGEERDAIEAKIRAKLEPKTPEKKSKLLDEIDAAIK
jgi:hypothetical protein